MNKRMAVTVSGLVIAGGTALTGGAAYAAGQPGSARLSTAPQSASAGLIATSPDLRPRCRWVRGHYRWTYRRGMRTRIWIRGHRVC
jgi:hypothetical protein